MNAILQKIVTCFLLFLQWVFIDAGGKTVKLWDVIEPFQLADFKAIMPALRLAVGLPVDNPESIIRRFWLQRPRSHSKSSDCALIAVFFLIASIRKRTGVIAARDREQAGFIRDAIDLLVRLNPLLALLLEVQNNLIRNRLTGSVVEVISADAMSAYGLLADLIICDEVTHWRNEELWGSLFTAAGKRESCCLICAMNAGANGTWQEELFLKVKEDPAWHCSILPGPIASYISQKTLDEQRRINPPSRFARYWLNQWGASDDQAVNEEDLAAAQTLRGPTDGGEIFRRDFIAVHGLDLGIRKDRSSLATCGVVRGERRIRLCKVQSWRPKRGQDVNLAAVERAVVEAQAEYGGEVFYDPHQCQFLAQRVRRMGVSMREMAFTNDNCTAMAEALTDVFVDQLIDIWPEHELLKDIRGLRVKDTLRGLRLVGISDAEGHCDSAIALSLCLPAAAAIANRQVYSGGGVTARPAGLKVLPDAHRHGVRVKLGGSTHFPFTRGGSNPGWRQ